MKLKKDILWRVYLIYFVICLFAAAIFSRIIWIQFVEGEEWRAKAIVQTTKIRDIEAIRGNILASDGSLLATSVPIFEIHMDLKAEAITDTLFNKNVAALSDSLSKLFQDIPGRTREKRLREARRDGKRFYLIQRNVKYAELQQLKTFPIFKGGRFGGGLICIQQNKRVRPFRMLAARTVGYDRPEVTPVGIEGAYRDVLKGVGGKQLMRKIARGKWMPDSKENMLDPKDGMDVVTTIDVNFQDVAERALLDQLVEQQAEYGCAVLMEVETGYIKAIANLSRSTKDNYDRDNYYENFNYAIGTSSETGSTIKLASLMVALEDGYIRLTDSVDVENGRKKFYDRWMRDDHPTRGKMTVEDVFVKSSNVGVAKLIWENYKERQKKYVEGLADLGLVDSLPLNIDISGEGLPFIKNPNDRDWSGITLPWMAIGYELQLTPLQILTFYNAVANKGRMVKPQFVKQIKDKGTVVHDFEPIVLKDQIASEETIEKAMQMMEGVVDRGTARFGVKTENFTIAGKTGTRQKLVNGRYTNEKHSASFVGYFPADNPKYSCIVIVDEPTKDGYFGGQIAGPVFREIANMVFASDLDIHDEVVFEENLADFPESKNGHQEDIRTVLNRLELPVLADNAHAEWVFATAGEEKVELSEKLIVYELDNGIMPDLKGMVARDVLYLLENRGLIVKVFGRGTVNTQSIVPGTKLEGTQELIIELG